MLVKNWMSKPVITIADDAPIQEAIRLLKKHEIRMLPVIKNDQLVGVVTERDLKRASASVATSFELHELFDQIAGIKVGSVMTKNPVTIRYDHTLEEAAERLLIHDISAAPVINQVGKLVGVITRTDVFKVLIALTGVGKKGIQLAFKLPDHPGAVKEASDVIRDYGGRIASILSTKDPDAEGHLNVYIHAYGVDRPSGQRIKEVIAKTAAFLYIVNHEEKTREIF